MAIGSEVFRIVVEMAANLRGVPNKVAAAMDMMQNKTRKMAQTSRVSMAQFSKGLAMPIDRFRELNNIAQMNQVQFTKFFSSLDVTDFTRFGVKLNDFFDENTGKFLGYANAQKVFASQITTGGGKIANSIRMLTHGMRGFRMEFLSVMFFGMNLSKMFGQWNNQVFKMLGLTDYFNVAMQDMVLTAIFPVTDALYGFIDGLMNLPDSVKSAIGWLMIIGQTMGQVLFFVGSLMLGIGGLILTFGKLPGAVSGALGEFIGFVLKPLGLGEKGAMGFFTTMGRGMSSVLKLGSKLADAFKGVMSFVAKWAGKAVKITASIVAKFGRYFLNFFSEAGNWLWGKAKTTVSFIASFGSRFALFISRAGRWLFKALTTTVSFIAGKIDAIIAWASTRFPVGTKLSLVTLKVALAIALAFGVSKWLIDFLEETTGKTVIDKELRIKYSIIPASIMQVGGEFGRAWKEKGIVGVFETLFGGRPYRKPGTLGPVVGPTKSPGQVFKEWADWWGGLWHALTGMQGGGIVTSPTIAKIGEAGPEAVIPLKYVAGRPTLAVGQPAGAGSFTFNNVINVEARVSNDIDVSRLADRLDAELYDRFRRRYYR